MNAISGLLLAAALLALPVTPRRGPAIIAGRPGAAGTRAVAVAVLAVVVGAVLLLAVSVSPAAAMFAAGGASALWLRRRRRGRRSLRRSEGEALAAALEVLVGELRVGAHPVQAVAAAAGESTGAVRTSLQGLFTRARLGADVVSGLRAAAATSAVPVYWERLAVCWRLAAEHGLAMSELMQTARRDIIDRQRFGDRVEAGLAGARATAAILAALPALGVLLGQLVGADPVGFLLGGGSGGWLLLAGGSLIGAGLAWSDRIIDGHRE